MSQLIPFEFDGQQVRVQMDEVGKPWWVAIDVCAVLDIRDVGKAVLRLRGKEKRPMGGSETPNALIINESGLYRLIMRSNKPDAERFQDWVFEDVLPSIRQTGKYEIEPKASDRYPELQAIRQLVESIAEARMLAEAADARASRAEEKSDLALHNQQWLTIREYVYLYKLHPQFPTTLQVEFGRYLTGYCLEQGIPVRNQGIGDRRYASEHAYHIEVIHTLLPPWLTRHSGQVPLRILRPEEPS